jgi:hypothetical protein
VHLNEPQCAVIWHTTTTPTPAQAAAWRALWHRLLCAPSPDTTEPPEAAISEGSPNVDTGFDGPGSSNCLDTSAKRRHLS